MIDGVGMMTEGYRRPLSAKWDRSETGQTGFADGFPFLVVSEASLTEVPHPRREGTGGSSHDDERRRFLLLCRSPPPSSSSSVSTRGSDR